MHPRLSRAVVATSLLLAGCAHPAAVAPPTASGEAAPQAPELASLDAGAWLNGAPMSLASARGQVVLVEAWDRT